MWWLRRDVATLFFAHLVSRRGPAPTLATIPTRTSEKAFQKQGCQHQLASQADPTHTQTLAIGSRHVTPKGVLRPAKCDAGATHEGP